MGWEDWCGSRNPWPDVEEERAGLGDFWHSCKAVDWLCALLPPAAFQSQLKRSIRNDLKPFLSGCGIFQRGSGRMGIFIFLLLPQILYNYKPMC